MQIILSSIFLASVLFLTSGNAFAETKTLRHIGTLKMEYSENWYSYNFAVCADNEKIEPFEVVLTSNLETKSLFYDKSISTGNCLSFGMMIHATDPEQISIKII